MVDLLRVDDWCFVYLIFWGLVGCKWFVGWGFMGLRLRELMSLGS